MENDVLKNKIAPWQEKGRWYHGVFTTDGDKLVTEKTDSFLLNNCGIGINAGYAYLRPNDTKTQILDCERITNGTFTSAGTFSRDSVYRYTDGRLAIFISMASSNGFTGTCEFWVFVVVD